MFDTLKQSESLKKSGVLALGMMALPRWMPRDGLRQRNAAGTAEGCAGGDFFAGGGGRVEYGGAARGPGILCAAGGVGDWATERAADASAIDLDGFFGLHPALRPLKDVWDEGALAAVHAVGSPDPTHSHFEAMDYMERGTPGEKAMQTGWIGRHLQVKAVDNKSPFRAVGLGTIVQQSMRGPIPTIALQSIADFHLKGEQQELGRIQQTISSLYDGNEFLELQGQETLAAMDTLATIANQKYVPANGAKYPAGYFGSSLGTLAQLMKSDLGVEVAAVDIGGWDTHQAEGGADGQIASLVDGIWGRACGHFMRIWARG